MCFLLNKEEIFIKIIFCLVAIATALGLRRLRPPERQIFPDQLLSYCNIRVLLYKHTLTVRKTALRLDSSNPRVK